MPRKDRKFIALHPRPLEKEVSGVLRNLGVSLRLVQACGGGLYRGVFEPGQLKVTYHAEPYEEAEAPAIPIFPPGTDVDIVQAPAESGALQPDDLALVRTALDGLEGGGGFGHRLGIQLLDLIMTREGKLVLRAVLHERQQAADYREIRDALHDSLRRSLGYGRYRIAVCDRLIGGQAWGGSKSRISLISGQLPSQTTKWHVGYKSDSSQTYDSRT